MGLFFPKKGVIRPKKGVFWRKNLGNRVLGVCRTARAVLMVHVSKQDHETKTTNVLTIVL